MKNHPITDVFPEMAEEEYASLKVDIGAHGLHEPCWTWQGQLIDGRHRLKACQETNVEPQFREFDGDEESMLRFVFAENLLRRHLSSSQKAAVGVDFEELVEKVRKKAAARQKTGKSADGRAGGRGKRKENLGEKVPEGNGRARDEIAAIVGTNPHYISDQAKVKAKAPELHAKVKAGQMSTKAAATEVKRREKAQAAEQVAAEIKDQAESDGELYRVEQGDCLAWFATQRADWFHLVFGSPPYEQARLYLENGHDKGIARNTNEWVAWMVEVYRAALRCCTGLVAFVVEGQTKDYRWSASPALLIAELCRAGICVRKPPIYHRVGIPGSGGPDWLRNDYEFIVCATHGGPLPWSDNTAMGQPPKYEPGGDPSHRTRDGSRVNEEDSGYAGMDERDNQGPHRARQRAGRVYQPPERANPGNVIACAVGGGNMGDSLCHENEAPFPEALAEFFVRSYCPPRGIVCDPFCGSGTTGAMARRYNRRFAGCDIRQSQVDLSLKRIARVQPMLPLEV